MRAQLTIVLSLVVAFPLVAQPLRIVSFDRAGNLLATNTTVDQRYSLASGSSLQPLAPDRTKTLWSRVAHSPSTAFRVPLDSPTMFFRVFADPFTNSDLAGHWTTLLLTAADDPTDWVGWARIEFQCDAQGTGTVSRVERSNGDTNITTSGIPLTLASDGTVSGFSPPSPVMALDKSTIYGVMNDGGGGCDIYTFVRRATNGFATADLQGQWTAFSLASPGDATQSYGWARFEVAFDAQGNGTFTAALRSDGTTDLPPSLVWDVSPDGTISGVAPSPLLALDKNIIWGVGNDPGHRGGYDFYVMVRRSGSGFSTADLEGRWIMFMLVTRQSLPGWAGWGRLEATIDAQGHGTFTAAQRSNGDSTPPSPFTFTVAPDGTISGLSPSPVMALDKNTVCGVTTEQTGGFNLCIMVRR